MTTHLIIPDQHAHPEHSNERADWLGDLIVDLKPDKIINMGDGADMASLCSYDRGKRSFQNKRYTDDIASHIEFQERMWKRWKQQKQKKPETTYLIGNHEERISRAMDLHPELEGAITYDHLELDRWYDNVVHYEGQTPGVIEIDEINYAHYFVSGVMGRAMGGEHHAYSLLTKHYSSCTCAHSHLLDFAIRTRPNSRKIMGLVAGVYQGYHAEWAGTCNHLWWDGVVFKRNVNHGMYDPQFISLNTLRKEYGKG
jgi:hypothetical protein